MSATTAQLRPYAVNDEAAAIALWLRSWREAYPQIDFSERLAWWTARWRDDLVAHARIVVAEDDGEIIGFVTVDAAGYLDQIVVAPEHWGDGVAADLLSEAKRLAPAGLALDVNRDNVRAIRFYEKHGFAIAGEAINPRSGAPTYRMAWRG